MEEIDALKRMLNEKDEKIRMLESQCLAWEKMYTKDIEMLQDKIATLEFKYATVIDANKQEDAPSAQLLRHV